MILHLFQTKPRKLTKLITNTRVKFTHEMKSFFSNIYIDANLATFLKFLKFFKAKVKNNGVVFIGLHRMTWPL